MDYYLKGLTLLIFLQLLAPVQVSADQGKELFDKQCASCHTLGGGDSGGPDLKGVTAKRPHEWLETVIMEPNKLTVAKDPVQVELVKKYGYEMPNLGIGHDDALKIIVYLAGASGAGAASGSLPAGEEMATAATPQLIAQGKALFTGEQPFAKGGAPCLSCHPFRHPEMQGGNLAADLTGLYERMGEQGVRGVLKSLKFPIMKKIYADRPLTDEEITALAAFTKDAAARKESPGSPVYPAAGAGLFVCLIIGLTLYKRRIR